MLKYQSDNPNPNPKWMTPENQLTPPIGEPAWLYAFHDPETDQVHNVMWFEYDGRPKELDETAKMMLEASGGDFAQEAKERHVKHLEKMLEERGIGDLLD